MMKFCKAFFLFCTGGLSYVGLEYLWRRRSHGSMFLAGGTAFMLLGRLSRRSWPIPVKALAGSGAVTAVELFYGLLFNRRHNVWDYRQLPFSYKGQICLLYSLLWMPVSLAGMVLYRLMTGLKPFSASGAS
jgi:hypothetical protein